MRDSNPHGTFIPPAWKALRLLALWQAGPSTNSGNPARSNGLPVQVASQCRTCQVYNFLLEDIGIDPRSVPRPSYEQTVSLGLSERGWPVSRRVDRR